MNKVEGLKEQFTKVQMGISQKNTDSSSLAFPQSSGRRLCCSFRPFFSILIGTKNSIVKCENKEKIAILISNTEKHVVVYT